MAEAIHDFQFHQRVLSPSVLWVDLGRGVCWWWLEAVIFVFVLCCVVVLSLGALFVCFSFFWFGLLSYLNFFFICHLFINLFMLYFNKFYSFRIFLCNDLFLFHFIMFYLCIYLFIF